MPWGKKKFNPGPNLTLNLARGYTPDSFAVPLIQLDRLAVPRDALYLQAS